MTRSATDQARIDAALNDISVRHDGRSYRPYVPPYQPTDQNLPLMGCALAGCMLVVTHLLGWI